MANPKKSQRKGDPTFAERLLMKQQEREGNTQEGEDASLAEKCPHVHELLTTTLVDDGRPLEPASLTVFCRSGSWHTCLSHKALKLKWWGEGGSLETALGSLEGNVGKVEAQGQG